MALQKKKNKNDIRQVVQLPEYDMDGDVAADFGDLICCIERCVEILVHPGFENLLASEHERGCIIALA